MSNAQNIRLRVLIGGIICQFSAGMLYSFSIYRAPMTEFFQGLGFETPDVGLAFSIATFVIPIVMILAGKLLPKLGPTITASIGTVLLVAGLGLSGLATTPTMLYIGYGALCGAGVGFIYGVPIATCVKWFPEKKGLISGLTVAGFGLGSIIYSPICSMLIESMGASTTFWVQGGITLVGMLIGAPLLKVAPDGFAPKGWTPPAGTSSVNSYTTSKMLSLPHYWFLLVMYLFANVAGLFAIGNAASISQVVASLDAGQAAIIVSVLSIANTCGRFLAGMASDKLGPARVVSIIYALNVALFLTMSFMNSFVLIAISIAGVAVCFGGMMGVYPTLVLDYFGPKYLSTNYAFIFLAYGFGGLLTAPIGNISANFAASGGMEGANSFTLAFIVIGVSCVVGCIMSFLSKKPKLPADATSAT